MRVLKNAFLTAGLRKLRQILLEEGAWHYPKRRIIIWDGSAFSKYYDLDFVPANYCIEYLRDGRVKGFNSLVSLVEYLKFN